MRHFLFNHLYFYITTDLEGGDTADRGPEEARHVVQPLGRVQGLEPGCLIGRGVAQGAQGLETLPDAVDVGQVHELDLRVEVILRALHPAPSGPVTHRSGVTPRVHDQHLPDLVPGRGLGRKVFQ